jgi:hypothetical protein
MLATVTRPKPGRSGSDEVKRVVEEAHDEAIRLLTANRGAWTGSPRRCSATRRSISRRHTPPPGLLGRKHEAAPVEAAAPVAT